MSKDLQSYLSTIEKKFPQHLLKIEKVDPRSFAVSAIIKYLINHHSHPIVGFENT